MKNMKRKTLPLIKAKQWLESWSPAVQEDKKHGKQSFPKEFYIASVPLNTLRALAGVSKRDIDDRRKNAPTTGYQREHQNDRSLEIRRYISYGYPLSKQKELDVESNANLIHPGWLPTAILVNIVPYGQKRRLKGLDVEVKKELEVRIEEKNNKYFLNYPDIEDFASENWENILKPIEIIDGQHRVFAISDIEDQLNEYEVPVIFFNGLSLEYQAYLFWVINVEPKKINPSLAFDLYPALRRQDWLEKGEGLRVYQEHRSQELTEILWRHPDSPWRDRIELHGARVEGHVSNAAFIRSLMASFVRRGGKSSNQIGGLFGSINNKHNEETEKVLPWGRTQQAAFLIFIWQIIKESVRNSEADWAKACRMQAESERDLFSLEEDPAFSGKFSLLATDQGVRALLRIFNAFIYVYYEELHLEMWQKTFSNETINDIDINCCISDLQSNEKLKEYVENISKTLFHVNDFDWRISSFPGLSFDKKTVQASYRGSSGYSLLYTRCINSLLNSSNDKVKTAAENIKNQR